MSRTKKRGWVRGRSIATLFSILLTTLLTVALRPVAAAPETLEWPVYSGDGSGMRYSTAAMITSANVQGLRLAWRFHTRVKTRASFESTAMVGGGRLFITAPDDEVFALNPVSGALLWHVTPALEPDAAVSRINRGVAYGDGRVYLATVDARLIAYDAATGRQAWQTQVIPSHKTYFESMAPLYDRGRVIVGVSAGEQEIRGFVTALDAHTGRELWRFHTVPGPTEVGGNTWPRGARYLSGGGPVWMTPVVDQALDLVIFCVANPSPDFNGAPRPGLNLFTDSIVALHAASGRLAWYFQEVHHDLWDSDPASPPALLTLQQHGQAIPAVIEAGKTGWLYVLDRRSGRPLVPTPERPVPTGPTWQHAWPTQPEPGDEPFAPQCPPPGIYMHEACIFTPPSETPALQAPGGLGGSAWSPVSYSPRTGLAYIAANDYPAIRSTRPGSCCFSHTEGPPNGLHLKGALVGYDVARGRIAWRAPVGGSVYGGSVVTAGDVVFSGESAGYVDAHDARTGRLLWHDRTGAGADAAPSVYVMGGREYVAVAAGGNAILSSPSGDTLDVFALP